MVYYNQKYFHLKKKMKNFYELLFYFCFCLQFLFISSQFVKPNRTVNNKDIENDVIINLHSQYIGGNSHLNEIIFDLSQTKKLENYEKYFQNDFTTHIQISSNNNIICDTSFRNLITANYQFFCQLENTLLIEGMNLFEILIFNIETDEILYKQNVYFYFDGSKELYSHESQEPLHINYYSDIIDTKNVLLTSSTIGLITLSSFYLSKTYGKHVITKIQSHFPIKNDLFSINNQLKQTNNQKIQSKL